MYSRFKIFESFNNCKVTNIILLQPSSPFRSVNIYNKTLNILIKIKKPTFTVSYLTANKIRPFKNNKGLKFVSNSSQEILSGEWKYIYYKNKDLKKQKSFLVKILIYQLLNQKIRNRYRYSL